MLNFNDIILNLESMEEILPKKLNELTVADLLALMKAFDQKNNVQEEAQEETQKDAQEEESRIVSFFYFTHHDTDNPSMSTRLYHCILRNVDGKEFLSNTNKENPSHGTLLIDLDAFVKYLKKNEVSYGSEHGSKQMRWHFRCMGKKTENFMIERLNKFGIEL